MNDGVNEPTNKNTNWENLSRLNKNMKHKLSIKKMKEIENKKVFVHMWVNEKLIKA